MSTIAVLTSGENGADSLTDINANFAALNSGKAETTALTAKQDTLVSGTNIKTINSTSLLGSGDISITGGTGDVTGPVSSTDNAITRFDSTTGKVIQNSTVTVADDGVIANVNAIQLDTTPSTITPIQGQIYWDTTEGTASINLDTVNGVTLALGTEQYVRVVNKTGSTITDGQAVYILSAQGNRPTVALARANAIATSNLIGVATQNIADNAEGFVTTSGEVHGYNTTGFAAGDKLYVSAATAGLITNVVPSTPDNVIIVGIALNSTVSGTILVKTHQSLAASSTLVDNSDLVAPSQKAVKTYADTKALLAGSTSQAFAVSQLEVGNASDTTVTRVSAGVIAVEGSTVVTNASSPTLGTVTTTGNIELGHASDTTIARVSAGVVSIEGNNIVTNTSSPTLATITTTGNIELGNASDTTLSRSSAGVLAVEGVVIPSISSTNTLTNKRITPRVGTTTSSATPTINTDNYDIYSLTAQTVDITSFTTNLSGTPTDGQKLWIQITGTAARAITWGASFESSTVTLPTTTVTTARLDVGFIWNTATSKWRCVATC